MFLSALTVSRLSPNTHLHMNHKAYGLPLPFSSSQEGLPCAAVPDESLWRCTELLQEGLDVVLQQRQLALLAWACTEPSALLQARRGSTEKCAGIMQREICVWTRLRRLRTAYLPRAIRRWCDRIMRRRRGLCVQGSRCCLQQLLRCETMTVLAAQYGDSRCQ